MTTPHSPIPAIQTASLLITAGLNHTLAERAMDVINRNALTPSPENNGTFLVKSRDETQTHYCGTTFCNCGQIPVCHHSIAAIITLATGSATEADGTAADASNAG